VPCVGLPEKILGAKVTKIGEKVKKNNKYKYADKKSLATNYKKKAEDDKQSTDDSKRSLPKKTRVNYDMGDNLHDDINKDKHINWFPGHMNKAIRQIKEALKKVDILLEVRDARSPLVTGNKAVLHAVGNKPRLIVINKTNLADPKIVELWKPWFKKQGVPFVFINCLNKSSLKQVTEAAKETVHQNILESNPDHVRKTKLRMMVIGLPNTGKSTIINRLANRNASKAADKPGQTRHQLWINVDKELEILDTPGVMPPKIDNFEQGLWLTALYAIPDTVIRKEIPACFLLEHFLKVKSEIFKEKYKFESFDYELMDALNQIGKARGCIRHKGEIDYERVYSIILHDFRSGDLGPVSFGIPPLPRTKA